MPSKTATRGLNRGSNDFDLGQIRKLDAIIQVSPSMGLGEKEQMQLCDSVMRSMM